MKSEHCQRSSNKASIFRPATRRVDEYPLQTGPAQKTFYERLVAPEAKQEEQKAVMLKCLVAVQTAREKEAEWRMTVSN